MVRRALAVWLWMAGALLLSAQQEVPSSSTPDPPMPEASTRREQMQKRRDQVGGMYGDDELNAVERAAIWAEDNKILERATRGIYGVRAVIGNLAPQSGFAIGPEYYRPEIKDGAVQLRVGARGSIRKYLLAEAELSFPKLFQRRAYLDLYTRWRNYPTLPYYGQGPNSSEDRRTAYRLEDAAYDFSLGLQPIRRMRLGVTGGYLQTNVGPGDSSTYASTDRVFSEFTTPGLQQQSNFLRGGFLASYDWRDGFGGAKKGGFYEARLDYFQDRDLRRFSHRRVTLEAQQYIPFLNRRRVIALRAKTLLTDNSSTVPFYMQPLLGGQNDLRGFQFARFYDRNAMVMNAEYRWEIFSGLDGALFYDAGKVFPRWGHLNFRDLEGSAGFGFRVNFRNATFLRVDVGFSHEGTRVWISFNEVFGNSGGVAQSLYTSRIPGVQ